MVGLTREQIAEREAAKVEQAKADAVAEAEERVRAEMTADFEQRERVAAAERQLSSEAQQRAAAIRPPLKAAAAKHPSVRDAASVAAELRDNRVTADEGHDKFYIDPSEIPDGWTYMWRRMTTVGKEDNQYMNGLTRRGWAPVPQERHPDIEVRQDGMILMEIPTVIYEEQKNRDERTARLQVASKEAQLVGETPEGHLPRTTIRGQKPITKTFEAHQAIPE